MTPPEAPGGGRLTVADPLRCCAALRGAHPTTLLLDGRGGFDDGWSAGPLLALAPRVVLRERAARAADAERALCRLADLVARRRRDRGPAGTGIVALLGHDLGRADADGLDAVVVLDVDRSLRFGSDGRTRVEIRPGADEREGPPTAELLAALEREPGAAEPATAVGSPRTSLPREAYLAAVERIRGHIRRGDVYQANLCQRFEVGYRGDELALYARLAATTPAPRSAFLDVGDLKLISLSPETFLRAGPDGSIATWPIKGTRPRGATPDRDAAAAAELLASAKDRAELLMIVDLERNDLGRVCRTGSVSVPELVRLRSFATVHHLVARVEGRLRSGVGWDEILRSTFPGGSISGAPKRRALEILAEIEPVRRNYFTGSLIWFGDDGTTDSSILIRTLVLTGGRALLGAGGGIVADSDPRQEWLESNHKARALASALGFDPEEAS